MAKMSLEDLRKLRESTQQQIKKRETEGKQAQIVVGMAPAESPPARRQRSTRS